VPAEQVACHAGVEAVFGQCIGATDQAEPRGRHDQVRVTRHPADRTGARLQQRPWRHVDFETHRAAMATAAAHHQTGTGHVRASRAAKAQL